jgi:co-chaperonin GroES (HSP10)
MLTTEAQIAWEESLTPLRRLVMIRVDKRAFKRKSGIVILTDDWPAISGWIVAVSPIVTGVEIGDYVYHKLYAGAKLYYESDLYHIVHEDDLDCVVE